MKKLLLLVVLVSLGGFIGCGEAKFPYLVSIQVSPGTPSVAAGITQQFTAQGTFSNGNTKDLTSLVTWSSSTPYVASIAGGGLATTYSIGSSTITASFTQPSGTVTGTSALAVAAPTLVSVVVTDSSVVVPGSNSLGTVKTAAGTSHQFLAYGIYTDGGERNITSSVTWSSSPIKVATINNAGRAAGITAGAATITATDPTTSLAGSTTLDVTNATVTAIVVSPVVQTIAPLTRLNFTALGVFNDGTTQNITADSNWSSSDTAAATVTNSAPSGVATGVASGSTTITAALGGMSGSTGLTVSSASLTPIALTPAASGVAIGSTLPLNAVGTFSDGTKQPINLAAAWSVSPNDGSIATVDKTGLVTGVAAGTATVKAQVGTVSKTATLTIENLNSIEIVPAAIAVSPVTAITIAEGTATGLAAIATLADGSTQDITSSVTWVSPTPATATISDALGSSGWASGIAPGTVAVSAVFDAQSAAVKFTVTNATLSTIAIMPTAAQNVALGHTQQYTAQATFSDSSEQDLTNQVTWTSSDLPVAVVNGNGLATSTGVGATMVKAAGDINGSTASDSKVLTVH
ncbi:MAG: Ig-like domain-containing protein [Terracidiphilus sp.]